MKTKKGIFEEGTLWNDRKNSFDVICALPGEGWMFPRGNDGKRGGKER